MSYRTPFFLSVNEFEAAGGRVAWSRYSPSNTKTDVEILGLSLGSRALSCFRQALYREIVEICGSRTEDEERASFDTTHLVPFEKTKYDLGLYKDTVCAYESSPRMKEIGGILVDWQKAAKEFNPQEIAEVFSDVFGVTVHHTLPRNPALAPCFFLPPPDDPWEINNKKNGVNALFKEAKVDISARVYVGENRISLIFDITRYSAVIRSVEQAAEKLNMVHLFSRQQNG